MMVKTGTALWRRHPHVTSGSRLSAGDRAGDVLKHWFGTWTLLGIIAAFIVAWLTLARDPGELRLNLTLSCMAAVQGIILQIAANRIDRTNAESQVHHYDQTQKIDRLLEQNTQLTQRVHDLVESQNRLAERLGQEGGA